MYDERYYGSGKILNLAIQKHGIENFTNEVIYESDNIQDLNDMEIYFIQTYKKEYGKDCYNIAKGGDGGNTMKYKSKLEIKEFKEKMTLINQKRCSTSEFKDKLSKATSNRYKNDEVRKEHSMKIREVWSDEILRNEQSKRLKTYYENKNRNCSFNCIKCGFILNDIHIVFESIKKLREFLILEYDYNPDRRTFKKLINNNNPYKPFHKNNKKLAKLEGMLIYKLDEDVETKADEFKPVGLEISTNSKCETTLKVEDIVHAS